MPLLCIALYGIAWTGGLDAWPTQRCAVPPQRRHPAGQCWQRHRPMPPGTCRWHLDEWFSEVRILSPAMKWWEWVGWYPICMSIIYMELWDDWLHPIVCWLAYCICQCLQCLPMPSLLLRITRIGKRDKVGHALRWLLTDRLTILVPISEKWCRHDLGASPKTPDWVALTAVDMDEAPAAKEVLGLD